MSNTDSSDEKYNRGGMIAFIFSMVFVFSFFVYVAYIHPGVDLGENVVDPKAAGAVAAFDINKVAEPWVSSPEMVEYGQKLFKMNCTMCHGNEGKGDGPSAAGINPKPRNLVEGKWTQGEGLIAHFNVLTKGITGTSMGAYAHFKPADRWAIVHFVDSITENKSKDDLAKVAEFAKTAK
jgi:mono/diheme cytochrome c family protein